MFRGAKLHFSREPRVKRKERVRFFGKKPSAPAAVGRPRSATERFGLIPKGEGKPPWSDTTKGGEFFQEKSCRKILSGKLFAPIFARSFPKARGREPCPRASGTPPQPVLPKPQNNKKKPGNQRKTISSFPPVLSRAHRPERPAETASRRPPERKKVIRNGKLFFQSRPESFPEKASARRSAVPPAKGRLPLIPTSQNHCPHVHRQFLHHQARRLHRALL